VFVLTVLTPLIQQSIAFMNMMMPPAAVVAELSSDMFSIPDWVTVCDPHHAAGDRADRQLGMCNPGLIVTCVPLIAVTRTT
jgi:hypothetical protein